MSGNTGGGVLVLDHGIVELRRETIVSGTLAVTGASADSFDGGAGVAGSLRSIVRARDGGTAVRDNGGHGVVLFSGSAIDFRTPPSGTAPVGVTGNGGYGLKCFAATNYAGDTAGITGNLKFGAAPAEPDIYQGQNLSCVRF